MVPRPEDWFVRRRQKGLEGPANETSEHCEHKEPSGRVLVSGVLTEIQTVKARLMRSLRTLLRLLEGIPVRFW